jgi:HSP20 family protein
LLRTEFNELKNQISNELETEWFPTTLTPSVDLSETADAIEVRMDLPGVAANEINVQLSDNLLTISGERNEEKEDKGRTFHRVERSYGSFARSITLPCNCAADNVSAVCKDGVLTVKLPKTTESKSQTIQVKG